MEKPLLSVEKMAALLGISVEDYNDLTHKGIEEVKNDSGTLTGYQVRISSNNKRSLLEKLDVDPKNIVSLTKDKVKKAIGK